MIQWSQQFNIINSVWLSFVNFKEAHQKATEQDYTKYKTFLNPSKFQNTPLGDFKFIVIYSAFKTSLSRPAFFTYLKNLSEQDIKEINNKKTKMITYRNTIEQDLKIAKQKVLTPSSVQRLYNKGELSLFYFYLYFKDKQQSRILKREIQKVTFFLSYFPKIKEHLDLIRV